MHADLGYIQIRLTLSELLVCHVEVHFSDLQWISVLMGTELSTASFLAELSAVFRANLRLVKHTKQFIYHTLMGVSNHVTFCLPHFRNLEVLTAFMEVLWRTPRNKYEGDRSHMQ